MRAFEQQIRICSNIDNLDNRNPALCEDTHKSNQFVFIIQKLFAFKITAFNVNEN